MRDVPVVGWWRYLDVEDLLRIFERRDDDFAGVGDFRGVCFEDLLPYDFCGEESLRLVGEVIRRVQGRALREMRPELLQDGSDVESLQERRHRARRHCDWISGQGDTHARGGARGVCVWGGVPQEPR